MTLLVLTKITVLFASALAFALFAKRATSATRHAVLSSAQLAALALPLLAVILPPLSFLPARAQTHVVRKHKPGPVIETAPIASRASFDPLTWIWLAGVAIVAASKLAGYARAFAITRRANSMYSDEVAQPSAFGRRILLPSAAKSWSDERVRIVLLHEQAHVARHDTLVAVIGDLACALYWFHPLAWLVAHRAELERERACDDRVLAAGITAGDYATTMLDVARIMLRRRAAAMPMAEGTHVEQRIRAILDPSTRRRSAHAFATMLVILAAAPLLAALARTVPRPRGSEPDLRGDAIASPFSERITPAASMSNVEANGPDAALIALLRKASTIPQRSNIDFVAERARWALTRVRDGQLVAPLIESLRDDDWRIRAYAAWALGHSGDRRATTPIVALLAEPNWRVRAMAAYALAELADPAAESAMLDHLGDDAWQVRTEVVHYLNAIGGHRAEVEAMRRDRHMAVRAAAEKQ
jgi:beta-lactamase regulating signal transducer with metallopeptidase domain